MILFINTFITNKRFFKYKDKPEDPRYIPSRFDIFKYLLSSLSVIKWEEVIIYCELDDDYIERYEELDHFINSTFDCEIKIYHFRNSNQTMWKVAVNNLGHLNDDQLIWFTCNDDHVFIDNNLDYINLIIEKQKELLKDSSFASSYLTHWPEMLALRAEPGKFKRNILEDNKQYFVMDWKNADSGASIINLGLLKYWWFENDYADAIFRRTDDPENEVISPTIKTIVPYREQVRHFDGYNHVGINPKDCPLLFIPEGFFESDIKISFCKKPNSNRYVYIDAQNKEPKAFSYSGSDMKCLINEIPLFWKSRISETINEFETNRRILKFRNRAVIALACSDKRGGFSPIRVVFFLKDSYFRRQNFFLILIDSLWVWKLNDFILHFTNIFGRKFPKLYKIIYSSYLKVIKS